MLDPVYYDDELTDEEIDLVEAEIDQDHEYAIRCCAAIGTSCSCSYPYCACGLVD